MQFLKPVEVQLRRLRNTLSPYLYAGDARLCPCCQRSFSKFLPAGTAKRRREDAVCPFCRSRERDRLMILLFEQTETLLNGSPRILHFAPEPSVRAYLIDQSLSVYHTTDLMQKDVSFKSDIQELELNDGSYDGIICAHVLQDVPNEEAALSELYRVLSPGGWAVLSVPVRGEQTIQYSGPEKQRSAWDARPDEHVRQYGTDFSDRLALIGFQVDVLAPKDLLADIAAVERHGLSNETFTNVVFVARKPH